MLYESKEFKDTLKEIIRDALAKDYPPTDIERFDKVLNRIHKVSITYIRTFEKINEKN